MSHSTDNMDHWSDSSNGPTPVRFTMRGQVQLHQPLDFSASSATISPGGGGVKREREEITDSEDEAVVDLCTRGRVHCNNENDNTMIRNNSPSLNTMIRNNSPSLNTMTRNNSPSLITMPRNNSPSLITMPRNNSPTRLSSPHESVPIITFSPNLPHNILANALNNNISALSSRNSLNNNSLNNNSLSHNSAGDESSSSSVVSEKSSPIWPSQLPMDTPSPFTPFFKKSPNMTRPFKAYPKDPLNLPLGMVGGVNPAETFLSQASNEAYVEFRRQMLAQVVAAKTRRSPSDSPVTKSSETPVTQPEEAGSPQHPSSSATDPNPGETIENGAGKDAAYWERRRKNNEAAKRSRDARRAKEDEIAIRAAFLEQENLKLKYEVAALRSETTRLRCMLYSS